MRAQTLSASALPLAAAGRCSEHGDGSAPGQGRGQRPAASHCQRVTASGALPWESCRLPAPAVPLLRLLDEAPFTRRRRAAALGALTEAAKGRRRRWGRPREKFHPARAQAGSETGVVFQGLSCLPINYPRDFTVKQTEEMLQLPCDLDGCQAQVNPFHLHQMQNRRGLDAWNEIVL